MPQEQDHALAYEHLCVVNARDDALSGEEPEKRGHVGPVTLNDCINVSGHPADPACDDRDSADHHPWDTGSFQSIHEGGKRLLDS